MKAATESRRYLPAAGRGWALPFYDAIVTLIGGDAARAAPLEEATVREARRVLRPGGTLHLLDFGGAGPPGHGWLHSSHRLQDNFGGAIEELMRRAGPADAR